MDKGSFPLSCIISSCLYQFRALLHGFTSGSYCGNDVWSWLNSWQCPEPSLPQHEHIFCTKIHTSPHVKGSSFSSIMCLFIAALQGNEQLHKSSPSLSLIFFSLSICMIPLLHFTRDEQTPEASSLKDGVFSWFSPSTSTHLEPGFQRSSISPDKLQ